MRHIGYELPLLCPDTVARIRWWLGCGEDIWSYKGQGMRVRRYLGPHPRIPLSGAKRRIDLT
jgi:hypothetical protein